MLILFGLIELSGKYLKNNQISQIKINECKTITAANSSTLLEGLLDNSIYLPAACGGKGTCGKCALIVESKQIRKPNLLEKTCLSSQQISNNYRLSCQVRPISDLKLTIANELLNTRIFRATLTEVIKVTQNIKILRFSCDAQNQLFLEAGQYIQIIRQLPFEKLIRAYSLSEINHANNQVEFALDVQLIEGGVMSSYLHRLKVNDQIDFSGPYSEKFYTQEFANKDIILIAGGIGLAPVRAILKDVMDSNHKKMIYLFHGARDRSKLYFEKYYRSLADKHPLFNYIPTLSNPLLEDGWTGKTGFVHTTIEQQKQFSLSSKFFICGPEEMIIKTKHCLLSMNINESDISTDSFT